jgi:hypothetical protein
VRSLADALANLEVAQQQAATDAQKATAPRLLSGARGAGVERSAVDARSALRRNERSTESSLPCQAEAKGVFEAFREQWQRQVCADRDLLPSARVVLCVLCLYLNRGTRTAWPSLRKLAKDTGMSRSSVNRLVKAAESRGHLHITCGNACAPNVYSPVVKGSHLDGTPLPHPLPVSVSPRQDAVSHPDGTVCPAPSGTEHLTEPLKEPLKEQRGNSRKEPLRQLGKSNHEQSWV